LHRINGNERTCNCQVARFREERRVEGRTVERQVELPAAPSVVWRMLTSGAELSAWFGAKVELDPRPGGRANFLFPDGRQRDARVEVFDPERHLLLRWLPFERSPAGTTESRPPGQIRFVLAAEGDRTLLTVTEMLYGAAPTMTTSVSQQGSS
jgi:prepilin-type processing-associated H-X9-DG protein